MGVRRAAVAVAALALAPSVASARARSMTERLGDLTVDFSRGALRVRGVGAPGLRAPTVAVARVAAERTARADAARRLRSSLASLPAERLGCIDATKLRYDDALARATLASIDYGSDGSVELVLEVALIDLLLRSGGPGTPEGAVVLVSPSAAPSLFEPPGASCAEAAAGPRVFDELADLVREFPWMRELPVVRERPPGKRVSGIARSAR